MATYGNSANQAQSVQMTPRQAALMDAYTMEPVTGGAAA